MIAPDTPSRSQRTSEFIERKFLSILFADIVDSTKLVDGRDPEDAMQRLAPALRVMHDAVHRYGGTLCRDQGDGIMALFGAPQSDDNHAVHAGLAGLDIAAAISDLAGQQMQARIGVHSGTAIINLTHIDTGDFYNAAGQDVHLAARLEALAAPGTVLTSARTRNLTEPHFEFATRETLVPKGFSEAVATYQIVRRRGTTPWAARSFRGMSPFIGRKRELSKLRDEATLVLRNGGRVVSIVADAGLGKSRLSRELVGELSTDGWRILHADSEPTTRTSPYRVLKRLIQSWIGCRESDPPAKLEAALRRRLTERQDPSRAIMSAMRFLLDLPTDDPQWTESRPTLRRKLIADAIRFVVAFDQSAVAMLFEDCHWTDSDSSAVLDEICASAGTLRALVICTTRSDPEGRTHHPVSSLVIKLSPLDEGDAAVMVDQLLGSSATLIRLKGRLLRHSGGSPLFLEELVRGLAEAGAFAGPAGNYRLIRDVEDIGIPASVQAIIVARVDKLPADHKTALQCAAVLGPSAPLRLLAEVASIDIDVVQAIVADLEHAGFVRKFHAGTGPEIIFAHDLVREAAQHALLRDQRRSIHANALAAYLKLYCDRLEEHAERVLDHAYEAQEWSKVCEYGYVAGRKAMARLAYPEAAARFEQAIDALYYLRPSRATSEAAIDFRLQARICYGAMSKLDKALKYAEQAETLADGIQDHRRGCAARIVRAAGLNFSGSPIESLAVGHQALADANKLNDEALVLTASHIVGQAHYAAGDYAKAAQILGRACESFPRDKLTVRFDTPGTTSVSCLTMCAAAHASMGQFTEARQFITQARQIHGHTGRAYDRIACGYVTGLTELYQGNHRVAMKTFQETLTLCREHAIETYVPVVAGHLGRAMTVLNRHEPAVELLEQTVKEAQALRQGPATAGAQSYLGLAYLELGRVDEACALAKDALTIVQTYQYRGTELLALRLLADITRRRGPPHREATIVLLRDSIEKARSIDAWPYVAQSQTTLAEVLVEAGGSEEPVNLLRSAVALYQKMGMTALSGPAAQLLETALRH
ncbi:ATP-binding protein [Vineibacter terrae]|uniref:ATP-binding protein n=1 Tax=Vineibacter terrae TaxID=2586908 RepID=UPI002E36D2D3|nr:adenylate/guanylate cyclase domain-containing protein [Vineibacter terrae]HEX2888144.1 adenylate/guanylate cyclase domain-containing protein [Vineibacter terrae]